MLTNKQVNEMLGEITNMFQDKMEELSKYDSVIGDGDHGITMARGSKAAWSKVSAMSDENIDEQLKVYGRTMISELGGAIGPLFGSIFTELARASKGAQNFGENELSNGITKAKDKIFKLGGAVVGDKTMVDSITPASVVMADSIAEGEGFHLVLSKGTESAKAGMESTIELKARKGRSKYLQDKSIGHQDAGATSFYYLMKTMNDYAGRCDIK